MDVTGTLRLLNRVLTFMLWDVPVIILISKRMGRFHHLALSKLQRLMLE